MGFMSKVKGLMNTLFNRKINEVFGVDVVDTSTMSTFVKKCIEVYKGHPEWESDNIKTINFAKSICSETARLATMGIDVSITGSARADWLAEQYAKAEYLMRNRVEYGLAQGTMILKPNGDGIDFIPFDRFRITSSHDGVIDGLVIVFSEYSHDTDKWYTRFEYHHFIENGNYVIENAVFSGDEELEIVNAEAIENSPWSDLEYYSEIENIDKPLFAVFKTPAANNIEINSSYGVPIFADALEELKDLDIAYSRNALEIDDSEKIVLLDSDRLLATGAKVTLSEDNFSIQRERMGLPHYVKNVYGTGVNDFYQEINPSLNTDTRLKGINALLSQIGYKIGFSNGYFVFNEHSGIVTATQIEADQQRTIQLIKDIRDQLKKCIEDLIYALDKFADLYDLAPVGDYDIAFDFLDITYNVEEDKARWYSYVIGGKIPFWYYLSRFEGFTEEDAKALSNDMQQMPDLAFAEE